MKTLMTPGPGLASQDTVLDAMTLGTTALTLFLVVCVLLQQATAFAA